MGVQALAAIAGVYPLQIVPRLVQLCALLAGDSLGDEESEEDDDMDDADGKKKESDEDDDDDDDDSESEDEEETEAPKEENRYTLLLLV